MAKIVIDESELIDPASLKVLENLANFFTRLEDPYRMPDLMAEFLDRERQSGVDTYYAVTIGYTSWAIQLRCTFKKDMLIMEFTAPDGMRLMELRLHR